MLRLALRVRLEDAELVLAELLELAPSGVEEVDLGEVVEYAVYGTVGELPSLPDLRAVAGGALVDVASTEIADDWVERWREFHVPIVLGRVLTVRPPWEPPGTTPLDIVIDPGRAFGTGAHATTRLCLELMLASEPGGSFLDLGCGSGVLAIAAAKLGWRPVIALDNDPAAVQATRANALGNQVEVEVSQIDLRSGELPHASTLAANLLAPLLLSLARRIGESRPERLIVGGVLVEEADGVARALTSARLSEAARRTQGSWAALALERS